MSNVLKRLNKKFEVTFDVGHKNILSYLSMQIQETEDGIFMNRPNYIKKILKRFNFESVNPVSTPMSPGMKTDEDNFVNDKPLTEFVPYRETIGSLLYLSTISRPDISFAVNYLSRKCNKPMQSHWKIVKRVFQYLKRTILYGIFFNRNDKLFAYSDADYAGKPVTYISTSGVLIVRGGPIVWFTKKNNVL